MDWEAIGAIGEILGALAVVATLAYLAVQVRQNSDVARGSAELEVAKLLDAFHSRAEFDRDLQRLRDDVAREQDLSDEDQRHYLWWIDGFFQQADGVFHQYQGGFVSEATWAKWTSILAAHLETPLVREWWLGRRAPLSEDFYNHIETRRDSGALWRLTPARD